MVSTSELLNGGLKRAVEDVRYRDKEIAITHYGELVARLVPYSRLATNPLQAMTSAEVPGKKRK